MNIRSTPRIFPSWLLFLIVFTVAIDCRSDATGQGPAAEYTRPPDTPRPMVIVITPSRIEQPSFDLPVSVDRIDRATIQNSAAKVNLSEPLIRVPGVVAQNRQNYAQDLQISVRGFGARSTFGVRGLRLYADGIPATMPDGQGQTSHFDLGSADRVEVLRGPFSALYGNSSGGVISVFSEDGQPGFSLSPFAQLGSYGTTNAGLKASGEQGAVNYVANASRFDTDGYRDHSAAARDTTNAKFRMAWDSDSSIALIGNTVSMKDIQDPLGLTRDQFESDPRSVHPNAILFNTRKSVNQQQLGLKYDKTLNRDDSVHAVLYGGDRSTVQYQAIPVAAQAAPTSAGGVIDLSRQYSGADVRWVHRANLSAGAVQWTVGINYDNLDEHRRGYENFSGTTLGVQGNLRRDEQNNVHNFDQYIQAQWEPNARWLLLAGVRRGSISIRSEDHYITAGNGDDSGSIRYRALSPVLGATFKSSDSVNLYASYGDGFETPTLNELSYRPGAGASSGFNFDLKPSNSDNYEAGIKAFIGANMRANLAVFHIDTKNEITVLSNSGGRAVFQNAGNTRRNGAELAFEGAWPNGVGALLTCSWLRAVYAESFCSGACTPATQVAAGNRIPGVPSQMLYGELLWRHQALGFTTALEGKYAGKIYVDDVNSDAASAYFIVNLRAGFEQKTRSWRWQEFVRLDNIGDRQYAGSVIVNESNQRFFEPAPGRNYLVGVSAGYSW
jgi:iron complex outermembrane receptor protein